MISEVYGRVKISFLAAFASSFVGELSVDLDPVAIGAIESDCVMGSRQIHDSGGNDWSCLRRLFFRERVRAHSRQLRDILRIDLCKRRVAGSSEVVVTYNQSPPCGLLTRRCWKYLKTSRRE